MLHEVVHARLAVLGGVDGQQDAQVPRQRQEQHQGEHGHLHLRHLLIALQRIGLIQPGGAVRETGVLPRLHVKWPQVTLVRDTFHRRSGVLCASGLDWHLEPGSWKWKSSLVQVERRRVRCDEAQHKFLRWSKRGKARCLVEPQSSLLPRKKRRTSPQRKRANVSNCLKLHEAFDKVWESK